MVTPPARGGRLALGMSAAHASDNDTLYFYNWTEYVPPGLLEQFTKETGIKVIYSTYESNETMYAKLKTYKDGAYDLVVPSTYYVDKMRKEGMIQKIDKSKLTNFHNLDPEMLNKPFDPNNDYSVPYIWGATAIGVNSDAIDPKTITSWADLWKPEYKNSLLLTDDAREVFQMALRKLGYSGNTTDPKEIEAAYEELKKLMPNVAASTPIIRRIRIWKGKSTWGWCGTVRPSLLVRLARRWRSSGRRKAVFSGWTAWLFRRTRKIKRAR